MSYQSKGGLANERVGGHKIPQKLFVVVVAVVVGKLVLAIIWHR